MLPSVTLEGRLVADPELRFTAAGKAVGKMRVACNSRVKQADGSFADGETCFLDVIVWEGKAENAAETLSKGALVLVAGRLSQRTYEASDGAKRTVYEVTADAIGPALASKAGVAKPADDPWANQPENPPF